MGLLTTAPHLYIFCSEQMCSMLIFFLKIIGGLSVYGEISFVILAYEEIV